MNISKHRLLKSHLVKNKLIPATQGPGTKPEQPRQPPEYPAPIEIPHPTEIPSPVPGDAPTEFPGPDENPTPEIEPPKEQLDVGTVMIQVQQIRSKRTTIIGLIPSVRSI